MANKKPIIAVASHNVALSAVIANFTVPATTEKFVTKDIFKVDTGRKAKVRISHLSYRFKELFFEKEEDPFSGSTISIRKLKKNLTSNSLLVELGGKEAAQTTLAEMYAIMTAQPNGKRGNLLINGWANIFYIEDIYGSLQSVFLLWNKGGWSVFMDLDNSILWQAGYRIFLRNASIAKLC